MISLQFKIQFVDAVYKVQCLADILFEAWVIIGLPLCNVFQYMDNTRIG